MVIFKSQSICTPRDIRFTALPCRREPPFIAGAIKKSDLRPFR
jgi:hypothetical protein